VQQPSFALKACLHVGLRVALDDEYRDHRQRGREDQRLEQRPCPKRAVQMVGRAASAVDRAGVGGSPLRRLRRCPSIGTEAQGKDKNVDALDQLIDRYGMAAILSIYPYIPDASGEVLRWVAEIDRKTDPHTDVRLREDDPYRVPVLVTGGEEFELYRWNPSNPQAAVKEPARISWSLHQVAEVVDRHR
jgi:hypothetical protein